MKTQETLDLLLKAQEATARADRSVILNKLIEALQGNKHFKSHRPKGCLDCLRSLMTGLFWDSLGESSNGLILCAPLFLKLCCESGVDWNEYQKFLLEQAKAVKD